MLPFDLFNLKSVVTEEQFCVCHHFAADLIILTEVPGVLLTPHILHAVNSLMFTHLITAFLVTGFPGCPKCIHNLTSFQQI